MKCLLVFVFGVCLSLGWGQAPVYLETQQQIVDLFASASQEILLYVPNLQSEVYGNALIAAGYGRKIPVFLLVDDDTTYHAASQTPSLSLVDGITVATLTGQPQLEPFAVIDGTTVVKGLLLSRTTSVVDTKTTVVYSGLSKSNVDRNRFLELWAGATPFMVDIDRLLLPQ
jgi:hypothetical protein